MFQRCVLFILLVIYGTTIFANPASLPAIKLDQSYYHLAGLVEVYDDYSKELELSDVRQLSPSKWQYNKVAAVNRGPIDAVIWVHFKIDATNQGLESNLATEPTIYNNLHHWQLSINNALLGEVELFAKTDNAWQAMTPGGGDSPIDFHTSPNKSHVFNLPITAGTINDYYLKVVPHSSALIPMSVMPKEKLDLYFEHRTVITYFYYGALSFMFVLFLLLAIGAKSKIFSMHALYIICVMSFNMTVDGFLKEYVIIGDYYPAFMFSLTALTTMFAGTQFTIAVLRSKERTPKLHLALLTSSFLVVFSIVAIPFLDPVVNSFITIVMTIIFSTLIVAACVTVYFAGYKEVRFFVLGWISFLLFTMVGALTFEGLLPWIHLTPYYIHLGSIIEITLISISLGDQFNYYRLEKLRTEQQAKEQLETINEQLVKSNQLKDQFLSTISHELRTPMNGVVGALDLIKQEEITPTINEFIETANHSAENMVRLIDDLLCFSDLLSNERVLNLSDFSLSQVKLFLTNRFLSKLNAKDITLNVNVDNASEPWLQSDLEKIKIILFQLADNAIKFTHAGKIDISMHCETHTTNQATLKISIQDSGIGMERDKVNNLYQAFHQVDASFNRKYGGLGIGLAICKKVVDSLEGEINIHSVLGQGTLVEVSIPVHIAEAPAHSPASHKIEKPLGDKHLNALIVEDNLVNQKVLAGFLKKLGVNSEIANNGKEGVSRCEQVDFNVIFMDCQMPVMDGFESTLLIRKPGMRNCNTPIVAVTANALESDREHCSAVGMNDFLKKPVTLRDIKCAIEKYCSPPSQNDLMMTMKSS